MGHWYCSSQPSKKLFSLASCPTSNNLKPVLAATSPPVRDLPVPGWGREGRREGHENSLVYVPFRFLEILYIFYSTTCAMHGHSSVVQRASPSNFPQHGSTHVTARKCNYVEVTCYSRLNNSKSSHSIESVPLGALLQWLLLVICVWSLWAAGAGDCTAVSRLLLHWPNWSFKQIIAA